MQLCVGWDWEQVTTIMEFRYLLVFSWYVFCRLAARVKVREYGYGKTVSKVIPVFCILIKLPLDIIHKDHRHDRNSPGSTDNNKP